MNHIGFRYNPTKEPTRNPTKSPSTEPSVFPTVAPTPEPFCSPIRIDVIDFDGFDSDELNDDVELQNDVANVTHYALFRTAITTNYSIDRDTFYVIFDDSESVNEYDGGELQRSLFVHETLCALQENDSVLLRELIQSHCDAVNQLMADKLTTMYLDGETMGSLKVSISDLSQLRPSVRPKCHDLLNLY